MCKYSQNENWFLNNLISVGSLPSTHDTTYVGSRALPSMSGNGAYLQHDEYFYELTCTASACSWSIMAAQLTNSIYTPVMMYLPSDYTC